MSVLEVLRSHCICAADGYLATFFGNRSGVFFPPEDFDIDERSVMAGMGRICSFILLRDVRATKSYPQAQ